MKNKKKNNIKNLYFEKIQQKRGVFFLILFTVLFIFYFSYLSIIRYQTLNSHYYDLGIMHQVVYNTAKGRFLEMTDPTLSQNISRLAIHFDPILAIFAPLYLIFNFSPEILLIGQALIVGLGGVFVYLLGIFFIKNQALSLFFASLYFLHYQVARAVIFDFHSVVLATTFLLITFYLYHKNNLRMFYFFLFLTLLTKEHTGLVISCYGIYLIFYLKDKKNGLICFLVGLLFFLLTSFVIIPYFRNERHFALDYYENYFAAPYQSLSYLISWDNLKYLFRLILPNFFSLFNPAVLIIALPEFLINLLSKNNNMREIYFHYQSLIIPVLFYGSIVGYWNLYRKKRQIFLKKLLFILFVFFNIYYFFLFYPLPAIVKNKIKYQPLSSETKNSIRFWQKILKDDQIKVCTTPKLAPFFSGRKHYYNFLFDPAFYSLGYFDDDIYEKKKNTYNKADYIIVYQKEINFLLKKNASFRIYDKLRKDKNFELIFQKGDIEVFKKLN